MRRLFTAWLCLLMAWPLGADLPQNWDWSKVEVRPDGYGVMTVKEWAKAGFTSDQMKEALLANAYSQACWTPIPKHLVKDGDEAFPVNRDAAEVLGLDWRNVDLAIEMGIAVRRGHVAQWITQAIGARGPPIASIVGRRIAAPTVAAAGGGATLLLDETGLGSAASAFSVRKLRDAYAGSALRVRRASDNGEQDIGFSSEDLDTSSLATFCSGTDGFVVTWYDQSGNARDLTQSTSTLQPQIVSSGSVLTGSNGKPVIVFDGTDDRLNATYTQAQPVTLVVVGKGRTYTSGRYYTDGGGAGNSMVLYQNGTTPELKIYGGSGPVCSNTDLAIDTYGQMLAIFNGASSLLSINDGTDSTGSAGTATTGGLTVGNFVSGGFASALSAHEVVVWPSALTTARPTAFSNEDTYFTLP